MPSFKHPCLGCGKYIARDAARCPFCGRIDPFVVGRCTACRTPIEDPAWVACPACGAPLAAGVPPMPQATPAVPPAASASSSTVPPAAPPAPQPGSPAAGSSTTPAPGPASAPGTAVSCAACGAALPAGSRFCTTCGTIAG